MKLEIKVSYKKVIDLGNYEYVHIGTSISEEIDNSNDKTYEEIFEELYDECQVFVLEKCDKELNGDKDDSATVGSSVDNSDIPF